MTNTPTASKTVTYVLPLSDHDKFELLEYAVRTNNRLPYVELQRLNFERIEHEYWIGVLLTVIANIILLLIILAMTGTNPHYLGVLTLVVMISYGVQIPVIWWVTRLKKYKLYEVPEDLSILDRDYDDPSDQEILNMVTGQA